MDVCIKNINDEDWRIFKAESAKHGLKMGDLFNNLVKEHLGRCSESNWDKVLYGKKTAKGLVSREELKEIRKSFEKQFSRYIR